VAIKKDRSLVSWGRDDFGEVSSTPSGSFIAVDAGGSSSVAIRSAPTAYRCQGRFPTIYPGSSNPGSAPLTDRNIDTTIVGTPRDDVIVTGNGKDQVDGGGGNDIICTNAGNDTVRGGAGDDYANGGIGDDTVRGGAGNDTVLGSDGDDHVEGGRGDDAVQGNGGDDVLVGGEGNDTCNGGLGFDRAKECETLLGVEVSQPPS
jgi:Ca2+-binding RTX toxin-like protein